MSQDNLTTTLQLEFKPYTHNDDKELEGVALMKSGELAVIGKYNDLGGVCDCCSGMNPEEDILAFAEIELSELTILDKLKAQYN